MTKLQPCDNKYMSPEHYAVLTYRKTISSYNKFCFLENFCYQYLNFLLQKGFYFAYELLIGSKKLLFQNVLSFSCIPRADKQARIDYEPSGTAKLGEDTCSPNNFLFSHKNRAFINCDSLPLVLGMLDSCPNASLWVLFISVDQKTEPQLMDTCDNGETNQPEHQNIQGPHPLKNMASQNNLWP